jgi:predicted nuclease with RNAse H fold/dephospho-CoA kinase
LLNDKKTLGIQSMPKTLPPHLREQFALCQAFPEDVMFLDIETTGLSHYYDEITVVGWAKGGEAVTFIKGGDPSAFLDAAARAKVLITFNGIRFDVRFLRQEFPGIVLPNIHIDLMYLCRRLGLTGGQKAIERELKIDLRSGFADVDGFAAVLLWHRYMRGELDALATLIRYNRADIGAMGAIFDEAISRFATQPDLFRSFTKFSGWAAPSGWLDVAGLVLPHNSPTTAPHFNELLLNTPAGRSKIVGIDLTGSEKRGSGWSLLHGKHAEVATIFADDELLRRTIEACPDLVSIDSPLSLPSGRTSVDDEDPGRAQFGIMRQCERELKRRGVNVYPCLLPSMQKLTARGIRLAGVLREIGIPVIESYPGAAQDIMRIPRKGAGIEWLRLGLEGFGIEGPYTIDKVSHDELDAITSALVGSFHLAGLTEALGTSDEAPLIIPDLKARPSAIVIGVSGPIAAGKTTFAKELASHGFAYTRFSLVIDDILRKDQLELNRENRQRLGQEINFNGRQRWLAEQTIARVGNERLIVVDGLRFPEDHAYLAEKFGKCFFHIHVDAPTSLRRERFLSRDNSGNFETAAISDVESRVGDLMPLATETFENDSFIDKLKNYAAEMAKNIGVKPCRSQSS